MDSLKTIRGFKIENSKPFTIGSNIKYVKEDLSNTRFNFVEKKQTEEEKQKDIVYLIDKNGKTSIKLMFRWGRLFGLEYTENILSIPDNHDIVKVLFIDDNKNELWLEYKKLREAFDIEFSTGEKDYVGIKWIDVKNGSIYSDIVNCVLIHSVKSSVVTEQHSMYLYTKAITECDVTHVKERIKHDFADFNLLD